MHDKTILSCNNASTDPLPAVPPPPDENRTTTVNPAPKPGTLLGVVIKTDLVNNPTPTADEPDDTKESGETQPKNQGTKKKTLSQKNMD